MAICTTSAPDRRRTFWTTQPGACGSSPGCNTDCGKAGLQFTASNCGRVGCSCCPPPAVDADCISTQSLRQVTQRSFVTTEWVRSLILNILLTDGKKPNTTCGYRPGAQGGHWSESYRGDGQKIGTQIRYPQKASSMRESAALIKAQLQSDLNRLIVMGIARIVTVDAQFVGGNVMSATVEVIGVDGTGARVGLTGNRSNSAWMWT